MPDWIDNAKGVVVTASQMGSTNALAQPPDIGLRDNRFKNAILGQTNSDANGNNKIEEHVYVYAGTR